MAQGCGAPLQLFSARTDLRDPATLLEQIVRQLHQVLRVRWLLEEILLITWRRQLQDRMVLDDQTGRQLQDDKVSGILSHDLELACLDVSDTPCSMLY